MAASPEMAVVVVAEGLGHDGAVANVAWHQAIGLAQHHRVCLLSDGLSPSRRAALEASEGRLAFRLVESPRLLWLRRFAHLPRQLLWILRALRALERQCRQQQGQGDRSTVICHSHPIAAAVAWRLGRAVNLVMVAHGDIAHRPPGSYDPGITCLYRLTTAPALRRADLCLALSPVMRERIAARGVPPERIALVPNGLDPAEIGLERPPATSDSHWQGPLRLLFVGRLDPVKGIDVLLQAAARLRARGVDFQLTLIGQASPGMGRELGRQVDRLGLQQRITLLGAVPRASLALHYGACHLLVVPSRDEPFGLVLLEAMACGRPVLASAVGGIPFILEGADCGRMVAAGDPAALAEAVAELDADRPELARLSAQASQRARMFSWAAAVQELNARLEGLDGAIGLERGSRSR